MKYIKILPLLMLLGCKLEEPKVLEKYDCQLPSIIAVTKDPVNGKKFSFTISPSTADVASLKWTIKNSSGNIVNSSNLSAYSLTLTNGGDYTVQAELVSKCGESKTLNADIDTYTLCNLLRYEYIYKSSNSNNESLGNVIFSYNAENEVIKEETTDKYSDGSTLKYTFYYEKNEANLGSSTQAYITEKADYGTGIFINRRYYCDLQKRVTKEIDNFIQTYTYGNDGFLEQDILITSNYEYRTNYKYTADGFTKTTIEFDKKTNTSRVSRVTTYTYSDQVRLSRYKINYGFNKGIEPQKYFKKEVNTYYDYSNSSTPSIRTSEENYVTVLNKNGQPISEKIIASSYVFEYRNFVFDCK